MEETYEAKSVDDCVKMALNELRVLEEEIDYEIIQEPSRGFLGIGAKNAVVKIKLNDKYNVNLIRKFVVRLLGFYKVNASVEVEITRPMTTYNVKISSDDSLSELIGKHGHTLNAVEHLLLVYLNKQNDHHVSVFVDVNNYKERKEELIRNMAENAVEKIRKGLRRISLEPMSSHERKIVHEVLSHHRNVHSYSVGTEPYRYVVIERAKTSVRK